MIDPRTVILLGEELDQLRSEMTKQARLLGISAEKELALRAENERLKKRCFPSKVLMIGDDGHYVSEAVFVEMERLKAELTETKKDAERYRWLIKNAVREKNLGDRYIEFHCDFENWNNVTEAIDAAIQAKGK